MSDAILADIVKKIHDLPALPTVVAELLSSIDQEDIDIDAIAAKIARDQALTAKTLRLANSSFYGMQHKVTTIQEAIAILGFRSVRTLITTTAITGSFSSAKSRLFNFRAFWRHSIATAVCAKQLAQRVKVNQDYAFTAGLLHDIGRLVLVTRYPEQYDVVLERRIADDSTIVAAERIVLGSDHAVVGRSLTAHWKFPADMQTAIADHHDLMHAGENMLTVLVHVADAIVHALDLTGEEDDLVPVIAPAAWHKLELTEQSAAAVFKETEQQFEEICQILIN